ncbi:unnamed protein product [Parascedosporium putredinis]|uniref:Adenosine deaminase domain-containing protein n=1 Tax=Parascedosporium putredinis TaxID=1442378 RepID=A0A9P1MFB6_9PEZI|nr:unnamed protein product [Parascedosporium putredinis]CAI8004708.1 unnamed protein product [Parascedosporium putredinis]
MDPGFDPFQRSKESGLGFGQSQVAERSACVRSASKDRGHAHHFGQPPKPFLSPPAFVFSGEDEYFRTRQEVKAREQSMGFDHACTVKSSKNERLANTIIQALKQLDNERVYRPAEPRVGFGGQRHARVAGDHFLSNVDLIDQTDLFRVAQKMPKGAHLHIHFNACLLPNVLLEIAKTMDHPVLSLRPEQERPGNLFTSAYESRQTMRFQEFLSTFASNYPHASVDDWFKSKIVFDEEEAHNHLQTCAGIWQKFNGRTRLMKGLFNYERAYRTYTRLLLEDFVRDNIQYAEIRPNFMETNQLVTDDASRNIDNYGIMEIIIDEYHKFQAQTKDYFGGSRSSTTFVPEFLEFRAQCERENLDIPFLFHCGETLDIGTDIDGNLVDALLLNAKRIGHGFALARHPYIMEQMKQRGVCLELCPISNEILGLAPRVNGHAMYTLLANNVPCTVSSDNGTLFRSTLSHDFYQVMIGRADMTLHGWRQLVEWSLQHSCMSTEERQGVWRKWEVMWDEFLGWIIAEYGSATAA